MEKNQNKRDFMNKPKTAADFLKMLAKNSRLVKKKLKKLKEWVL